MLHLIPAPLHRSALRIAHRLRVAWWRHRRPAMPGVSVMAFDSEGRVLLVRHSYGTSRWSMPGGAPRSQEDPQEAAAREFEEELRCPVHDMELVAVRDEPLHGATNRVHLYRARIHREPRPDGREILEARFFALDQLPLDLENRVRPRLVDAGLLEKC